MSDLASAAQIHELIEPSVEALGFELWALEYNSGGKRPMLRIFIESENGITVDDCAAVSRQVSAVLDVEDPISSEYQLEVSSPGAERTLNKLDQFARYAGYEVLVRLRFAMDGRRNFKGILVGVEQDEVVLRVGNEEYLFPIEEIDKANVIPNWDDSAQ